MSLYMRSDFPNSHCWQAIMVAKKKCSKDQLVNKVAKSTKLLINDLIATYKIVGKKKSDLPSTFTYNIKFWSLQDVVLHSKKLNKKSKNQLEEMVMVDKQGIKGLSKERRKKLEAYQHLFYLLQVSLRVKINMTKLLKEKSILLVLF